MIFPLVRNFEMAESVKKDVLDLLKLGKNYVLKVLVATAVEMEENQPRYLLNILYLNDLVSCTQNQEDFFFENLASEFSKIKVKKDDLGLYLDKLEQRALEEMQYSDDMDSQDE